MISTLTTTFLAVFSFTLLMIYSSHAAEEVSQSHSTTQSPAPYNHTLSTPMAQQGHRPSIWSRTVHHNLRENSRKRVPMFRRPYLRRSTEMRPVAGSFLRTNEVDDETELMKSEPLLSLRDFANQLVNETAKLIKAAPEPRSYPGTSVAAEDPNVQQQTQQLWDDKDQAYHASSYTGLDYEPPTSYHHPFPHHQPPPVHYYPAPPPPKKDDSLFTKVALLALLKLILAKLKAIGFLKLMLLFMLKVPLFFFKMLIAIKGFKILKLVSIPFLMAAFALPFAPLIPFFFFSFLPFLFAAPLFFPLLLPFLLFLPIVPVTTPPTAPATGRRKRDLLIPESVTANTTWSPLDEAWKNERKKKMFRTRARPASTPRRSASSRYEPFLSEENTSGILELTQRVVQSQKCMERAACELASYNDSKIYQSAVIWALGKLQTFAPPNLQRRIEDYTQAYERGIQRRSSDFCAERFHCVRPKVYLVQGHHSYNVI